MAPDVPRGRPCKLTPELQRRACRALALGHSRQDAAAAAGVHRATLANWMRRGRRGEGEFRDFFDAIKKAELRAITRCLKIVAKAAVTEWQAAAWFLERKRPAEWSRDATLLRILREQVRELEAKLAARPAPRP